MQYEKRRRNDTTRIVKRAKQDNPELNYAIITQMKIFMGEPEGRKLFFDTYKKDSYSMSDQDSIVNSTKDLKKFLTKSKKEWKNTLNPLLLVITYKNHYTGIRVDETSITLFDPNYNHNLYTPITTSMKNAIKSIFKNKEMKEYTVTCQITNDEADSFCQTWSMYLLTHPTFQPPEKICDRLKFILKLYKNLLKKGKKRYTEFLKQVYLVERYDTGEQITVKQALSIQTMDEDSFIRALYGTTEEFLNKNYQCLKL